MIRHPRPHERDAILELWLRSTTVAHPFIPAWYWRESLDMVRNVYLPNADTWVHTHSGLIDGFASVLESRFLGALFVDPGRFHRGVGSALMHHIQQDYPLLSLEVYQKNRRAVFFYHDHGFRIQEGAWQEDTGHPTWIMSWRAR